MNAQQHPWPEPSLHLAFTCLGSPCQQRNAGGATRGGRLRPRTRRRRRGCERRLVGRLGVADDQLHRDDVPLQRPRGRRARPENGESEDPAGGVLAVGGDARGRGGGVCAGVVWIVFGVFGGGRRGVWHRRGVPE